LGAAPGAIGFVAMFGGPPGRVLSGIGGGAAFAGIMA
jgi:hypothetical protein